MAAGPHFAGAWESATGLNESLAAWMELHFAREDRDLLALIWSFIKAGEFPDWPYRGAETVEKLYASGGIESIIHLTESLRADPESAQAAFVAPMER